MAGDGAAVPASSKRLWRANPGEILDVLLQAAVPASSKRLWRSIMVAASGETMSCRSSREFEEIVAVRRLPRRRRRVDGRSPREFEEIVAALGHELALPVGGGRCSCEFEEIVADRLELPPNPRKAPQSLRV